MAMKNFKDINPSDFRESVLKLFEEKATEVKMRKNKMAQKKLLIYGELIPNCFDCFYIYCNLL